MANENFLGNKSYMDPGSVENEEKADVLALQLAFNGFSHVVGSLATDGTSIRAQCSKKRFHRG